MPTPGKRNWSADLSEVADLKILLEALRSEFPVLSINHGLIGNFLAMATLTEQEIQKKLNKEK